MSREEVAAIDAGMFTFLVKPIRPASRAFVSRRGNIMTLYAISHAEAEGVAFVSVVID